MITKFPVKIKKGRLRFIRTSSIYYIEGERDDILIRTRSKTLLQSLERLGEAERRLVGFGNFFRCHHSFIVNLDHVGALKPQGRTSYALKLDPPVNKWLPLSEDRYRALRQQMKL